MLDNNNFHFESDEESQKPYPEFFFEWDKALDIGRNPGYYESDEISRIIEIYLEEDELEKAKTTVDYALQIYPDNEDLIYDIMLLFNDFELWNDLLILTEEYKDRPEVWIDGHRITALLHLGMEEDVFIFFRKAKTKYADNEENLSVIYQTMGEALYEVDLFEASINVIEEACKLLGNNLDFYWLQMNNYLLLENKEKVLEIAEEILKINPFDDQAWYNIGIIYKDIEELDKAIEAFEFAQNLGFTDKDNYINLIQTYEQNGNYAKALEKAKEYLQIEPENYLISMIAANICAQMEMWEEAIHYISDAIYRMPEMESLYLCKSTFLLHSGEQQKAILVLKEGIKKTRDSEGSLQKELERINSLNTDTL
jgi:tetratricopeptide (TPR) repeat protein